ncbi:MAG: AlpA family phage regulatory protein [Burkholderiaceae bacterium]|nr:AlpA family phage regulatory protein [Burkholderiaceae bacterium]
MVIERTGLSRSTIFAKLDPTHRCFDPQFPKRIRLGLKAVGWIEREVEEWIKNARILGG